MNIMEASSAVLKSSTRVAWWGLALGVFVGLHVAGALAKPLAGEMNKGFGYLNRGVSTLRSRMAKKTGEEAGDFATKERSENQDQKKGAAAAGKAFKIPVEDVAPTAPSEGARPESRVEPAMAQDIETKVSGHEIPGGGTPSLHWLKADLLEEAKKLGISVRQNMTKKELLDAINTKG